MENLLSRSGRDAREARRYRAYELSQAGWTQTAIAEALGVTQGAVRQWLKRASEGGAEALQAQPIPGAPRRLKREELANLPEQLSRGAEAFGFAGAVWTCERVAAVIRTVFGVSYTPQRVGTLLRELGWSRQKPQRKARQQDPQAIETFRQDTWPALKPALKRGSEREPNGVIRR